MSMHKQIERAAALFETGEPAAALELLFPAFMYHGTVPFSSSQKRICIAFDVIPDWGDKKPDEDKGVIAS